MSKASLALRSVVDTYYYRYSWFQLIRPMTLTGTISPVLAGTGFAAFSGPVRINIFIALFVSAVLIQAATNMLNDYFDFRNGQDRDKWMSGEQTGSDHGPAHHAIPFVAGAMFGIAVLTGIWLAFSSSLWVMMVGVLGICAGYRYSAGQRSFSSLGLGEFVAAIFLGPVVTVLAYVVQGRAMNLEIIVISVLFAFLIASMVLTNNIRDIEKDRAFRTTLAHRFGRGKAVQLLTVLLTLPYFMTFALIVYEVIPASAVLILFALPIAFRLLWSFRPNAKRRDEINGMKWAARHHWAFGLLFVLGLWL